MTACPQGIESRFYERFIAPQRPRRVVHFEDSAEDREHFERALVRSGGRWDVLPTDDTLTAIRAIATEDVSFVVLDHSLGYPEWRLFYRILRDAALPFAVLSGHDPASIVTFYDGVDHALFRGVYPKSAAGVNALIGLISKSAANEPATD